MFISFRTPSTAESIESPFGFPESRSGTNSVIASSGNPTESENISNTPEIPTAVPEVGIVGSSEQIAVATGSCVALSSPVLETKSSGSLRGNSADVIVAEKLPECVPEEGSLRSISEKENAFKGLGTLSYPVTESNHPRTPTENSSDAADSPGRLLYPIPEENKKPELGELERAVCTSRTETTATTAGSQDAALSSIDRSVNRSSSERCTPLSGIGKKLNHRKASEESRATAHLQKQQTCRDEKKTASASSAMQGTSGKRCSLVWVLNSVVQVSTTP